MIQKPATQFPESATQPAHGQQASKRRGSCLWLVLGTLLVLLGIPMLVLPGPGIAAILGGLAMIAKGLGVRGRNDAS